MIITIEIASNGIHGYATLNIKNAEDTKRFPIDKIYAIVEEYNRVEIEKA